MVHPGQEEVEVEVEEVAATTRQNLVVAMTMVTFLIMRPIMGTRMTKASPRLRR
jgi:hypothetical protein